MERKMNVLVNRVELDGDVYKHTLMEGVIVGTMNEEGNEVILAGGKVLGTFEKANVIDVLGNPVENDIWAPDDEEDDYYIVAVDNVRLPELVQYLTPDGMRNFVKELIAGNIQVDATQDGLITVVYGLEEDGCYASVTAVMDMNVLEYADYLNAMVHDADDTAGYEIQIEIFEALGW